MNINNQNNVLEGFKNRIDHLEAGRKATLASMSGEELLAHIQNLAATLRTAAADRQQALAWEIQSRTDRNDQIIDV